MNICRSFATLIILEVQKSTTDQIFSLNVNVVIDLHDIEILCSHGPKQAIHKI